MEPLLESAKYKQKVPDAWRGDTRMDYIPWRYFQLPSAKVWAIGNSGCNEVIFTSELLEFVDYNDIKIIKIHEEMPVDVFKSYLGAKDGSSQRYMVFITLTDKLLLRWDDGSYESFLIKYTGTIRPKSQMTYLLRVFAENGESKDYPVTN